MRPRTAIALLCTCLAAGSCGLRPRPATVPVRTMWQQATPQPDRDGLTIMLPGRFGRLPQYRNWGFFELLEDRRPGTDMVAADLHLAYYEDQSFARRIREDLIAPARARGVGQIELLGISLGGFGALAYAIENPGSIDRIVVIAPFLGEEAIIDEIEAAGGLGNWSPGEIAEEDFQRRLWAGLKQRLVSESGRRFPPVLLGFANGDRFARGNRLLAQFLPRGSKVFTVPGGHDWPEWRQLYRAMLDSQPGGEH